MEEHEEHESSHMEEHEEHESPHMEEHEEHDRTWRKMHESPHMELDEEEFFLPIASWLSPGRSTRSIGMQHVSLIKALKLSHLVK